MYIITVCEVVYYAYITKSTFIHYTQKKTYAKKYVYSMLKKFKKKKKNLKYDILKKKIKKKKGYINIKKYFYTCVQVCIIIINYC